MARIDAMLGRRGQATGVVAHRGASGLIADNTLAAFSKAAELGADGIEIDLCLTSDDRLIIRHDLITNERDQGASAPVGTPIRTLSFDQVRAIDVGALPRPDMPGQQAAPGSPPPTLDELRALLDDTGAHSPAVLAEIKSAPASIRAATPQASAPPELAAEVVCDALSAWDDGSVVVQSFDLAVVKACAEMAPGIPRLLLALSDSIASSDPYLGASHDRSLADLAREVGAVGVAVEQSGLTADTVAQLHSADLAVAAWTVAPGGRARQLAKDGVNAVITDHVTAVRAELSGAGETPHQR